MFDIYLKAEQKSLNQTGETIIGDHKTHYATYLLTRLTTEI